MRMRYSMAIVGAFMAAASACGDDDTGDGSGATGGSAGAGQGGGTAGSGSGGEGAAGGAGGAGASGGSGGGAMGGPVSVACQECATASCMALSDACSADMVCRACILVDYSDPSCAANANWTALGMCLCGMNGAGPCAADCPCDQ